MARLVDLSIKIEPGMPVYPGNQRFAIFPFKTHEEQSPAPGSYLTFEAMGLLLADHGGTHSDAFTHMDPDPAAPSVEQLPLEWFFTPAVCLDVSDVAAAEPITRARLERACEEHRLSIPARGTVLLYTGHYERYYPSRTWMEHHTGPDRAACEWLADQGVINIGVDMPSVDWTGTGKPAHEVCRERRLINTENLGDLRPVVGKRFTYIGFPLGLVGATASPVRAVALLE